MLYQDVYKRQIPFRTKSRKRNQARDGRRTCMQSIPAAAAASVSYTHLDVYKRQLIQRMENNTGQLTDINLRIWNQSVKNAGTFTTVSYTHLDVYKRQVQKRQRDMVSCART